MQINHISSDSVFGWPIWLSGLPRSNMTWCFPTHFASWPSKWRVDFPEYLLEFFGPQVLTVCIQGGISENETEELFSLMLFRGHSANWFCNFFIFFFFLLENVSVQCISTNMRTRMQILDVYRVTYFLGDLLFLFNEVGKRIWFSSSVWWENWELFK